jgi:hypothetical protein
MNWYDGIPRAGIATGPGATPPNFFIAPKAKD